METARESNRILGLSQENRSISACSFHCSAIILELFFSFGWEEDWLARVCIAPADVMGLLGCSTNLSVVESFQLSVTFKPRNRRYPHMRFSGVVPLQLLSYA
jgi:hypothetical protein